jgi:hypothetical protein
MSTAWQRTRYADTGQTVWTRPGFIITKESGCSRFTLQTTPGDSWPVQFGSLHQAKMAAEQPIERLREKQRESYLGYHGYFARLLREDFDDRILKDAVDENARRFQSLRAA